MENEDGCSEKEDLERDRNETGGETDCGSEGVDCLGWDTHDDGELEKEGGGVKEGDILMMWQSLIYTSSKVA